MSDVCEFKSATMNPEGVMDISPQETFEKRSQVTIIDVRRPSEWSDELGHIHEATLVTLETDLFKHLDQLAKDKTYVFVCRSGGRSSRAASVARVKGIPNVFNMAGGMMAWNRLGLPTEK